jgi:cell wall-associated NlpC family hydrolase
VTGWDCSGMTYWLDQKYGGGQLPMGSHYQYQYAQQSGRLFTDLSQLQSGDLVFIDTGWQGGAGAELNRAGHVAVYIGNGQILHAANQQAGTIVSQLSAYGNVLGGMKQSFSGGLGGGMQSSNPYRVRSAW